MRRAIFETTGGNAYDRRQRRRHKFQAVRAQRKARAAWLEYGHKERSDWPMEARRWANRYGALRSLMAERWPDMAEPPLYVVAVDHENRTITVSATPPTKE